MSDRATVELSIVTQWLEAVNARDVGRLLELSAPEIAIIGPRGRNFGHEALSQWLASAGLTLTSLRHFQKDDTIVVEQHAVWRPAATSGTDSSTTLAIRFRVHDGLVAEIERFDNLQVALAAAGLSNADESA